MRAPVGSSRFGTTALAHCAREILPFRSVLRMSLSTLSRVKAKAAVQLDQTPVLSRVDADLEARGMHFCKVCSPTPTEWDLARANDDKEILERFADSVTSRSKAKHPISRLRGSLMSFVGAKGDAKVANKAFGSLNSISEGGNVEEEDDSDGEGMRIPTWAVSGGLSQNGVLKYVRGESYKYKKGTKSTRLSLRSMGNLYKMYCPGKSSAVQEKESCVVCGWVNCGRAEREKAQTRSVVGLWGRERGRGRGREWATRKEKGGGRGEVCTQSNSRHDRHTRTQNAIVHILHAKSDESSESKGAQRQQQAHAADDRL